MHKTKTIKNFIFTAILVLIGSTVSGQTDCELYQWPEAISPCPEVQIKQKHDHTPKLQYRQKGWDTVIDCNTREGIILTCMPYIPVQYFGGTYTVEQIPFNPPDTTFYLGNVPPSQRQQQAINSDDRFAPTAVDIAFPFYFFGIRKNYFRIGDNGIVTFTTGFSQDGTSSALGCPYSFSSGIPWTTGNTPTYSGDCFNRMHDAIYGVYEDTYTGSGGSYMSGNQGIYYGVIDDFPCRKIIATWYQIPVYNNNQKRETYQIVCYEGSNIIEVHVKTRDCCPSTSQGIIGIQNATGVGQVKSNDPTAPNFFVQNGAPPAFFPAGYNPMTGSLSNIAFRFTPQAGTETLKSSKWYRIFDDGRDSVELPNYDPINNPEAMNDTNGYAIPMNSSNTSCPTLTKAVVKPTTPSKYVYHLRFRNANNDPYDLRDTIFVGIDTVNDLTLTKNSTEGEDPHVLDICSGRIAAMSLNMTSMQDFLRTEWHVYRELGGEQTELSNLLLQFGVLTTIDSIKTLPVTLNTANLPALGVRNKIDSIYIRGIADFTSGCNNNDLILVRVFPNFDTIMRDGICQGETYTWTPSDTYGTSQQFTYTENTDPTTTFVQLRSMPGCDSTVHLALTVFDISHTTDTINDCKPILWQDSMTYTQSNHTASVVLKNKYNCDSIVHLNFTLYPLTARLRSNVDHFSLDNLDAELTDISTNGISRVWKLPAMADQTSVTAYYSIPVEMDGAEILLIESSEYGCLDTASIYIPLNKENFWIPNIFTPDNPSGNNTFGSVSTKTLYQKMLIYNRRGELVFYCEGPDCTWDGRDLNGNPCIQDAYVYIIHYTNEFEPKKTKVIKGTVTLLR